MNLVEYKVHKSLYFCQWFVQKTDIKTQKKIDRIIEKVELNENDINTMYAILLSDNVKREYKNIANKVFTRSRRLLNQLPYKDEKPKILLNEMLTVLANV